MTGGVLEIVRLLANVAHFYEGKQLIDYPPVAPFVTKLIIGALRNALGGATVPTVT